MHATRLYTILLVSFFFSATADSLIAQTITHVPLYTFNGDDASDVFSRSVSCAGDVNGDGTPDLIVGANGDDNNGSLSGSARVFSGSDSSVLYNFYGDSANDWFGVSVSGVGDVNGDGNDDFIVGAPGSILDNTKIGYARVFSGSDGSVLYNFDSDYPGDLFGSSVSGAGDVNGDGIDDFIVGAPGSIFGNYNMISGYARVFSGSDGSILYDFLGDSAGDQFGGSVSGAGDVNGDGMADLIVGAPSDDNNGSGSGSVRVLSGSDGSILYNFDGDFQEGEYGEDFGKSVSGAGDVNGDGIADLIVGAWLADNNGTESGRVRVLSGSDGSILYAFDGDNAGDRFGFTVSGAGDVNGDGMADVIVGASGSNRGSVRVLSGSDGTVIYDFDGDNEGDNLCRGSGAGDFNGDGIDDFMIGSASGGANDGGYVRVFVSQISPSCLLGDVDLSGTVDFLDIAPFIAVLSNETNQCEADCDQSGNVTFLDIQPFIAILSGQ